MKSYTGKTVEEALQAASEDMGIPAEELIYSETGKTGEWEIPDAAFAEADVFALTAGGSVPRGTAAIVDGKVFLDVPAGQALLLRAE